MENSEKLEGKCSYCPKILVVRVDGVMRYHGEQGRGSVSCPGSMAVPLWTRPFQKDKKRVKTKN